MGWKESYERASELAEQLENLGHLSVTRLFGGAAIRVNGLPIAFVMGDVLYGRTRPEDVEECRGRGLEPFQFTKSHGEVVMTSYFSAPAEALDEPELMDAWARRALDAAVSTQLEKSARARKTAK